MTIEEPRPTTESYEQQQNSASNEAPLSPLSLTQSHISELSERIKPINTIGGVVRNLLSRLPSRRLSSKATKEDTNLLVDTFNRAKDTVLYGTLLAGPAVTIWLYQNLLRLTGRDTEDAFPQGTWQFYVEYALREDTARHAIETDGFDEIFDHYSIRLSQLDRFTSWVMASIHMLHEYDDILENEWRERVYISVLRELTIGREDEDYFTKLYRAWEVQRPYNRNHAQLNQTYSEYREELFDKFLQKALKRIPDEMRRQWVTKVREEEEKHLEDYKDQMTILAYLEPDEYGESPINMTPNQANIGIIYQSQYYLIPIIDPATGRPPLVQDVRKQIASILGHSHDPDPVQLMSLSSITRSGWSNLKSNLNPELIGSLLLLRTAPILINFDQRPRNLHLSKLRQAERGIGDHAMTIFDTGETFIFDLSHIFFDGTWGAALAEIMTNEASSWGTYLRLQPRLQPSSPLHDDDDDDALPLNIKTEDWQIIQKQPHTIPEASGETAEINMMTIVFLRKFFKQRSDLLGLTVNDILVLYRAMHAMTYEPDEEIVEILENLQQERTVADAATAALNAIDPAKRINPVILIPLDASKRQPRDRLHPMTFSVPFEALDLSTLHQTCLDSMASYNRNEGDFDTFKEGRQVYFSALAGFGELFSRTKDMAALGENASIGSIRMLAHLPRPIQRLLDNLPNRFEVLNDVIKGREVFSNIGQVVPDSTLKRFMTAKDDNENKTLVWAVMTDAKQKMHITLRDFRPHVALLSSAGYEDLADRITQDYLDAYATGLNSYVSDLLQITLANPQ